jgi:hypothetical protein
MRRNRSRRDKAKHFDGTINSKSLDLVVTLIQHLEKHVSLEGLYRIPGDMGEVRRTKEALNQGKKVSYEGMNPHTIGSILKVFFKELDDAVFTSKLYHGWITAAQHKEKKILITRLLNMLPSQNLQLISALMIHLQKVAEHHSSNLMTAENLAIVFGPILLRPSSVSVETLFADVPYVNKCIGLLISECSFFFQNKLVLLQRQTKKTDLFEEMCRVGAELQSEERKKRMKEEKRAPKKRTPDTAKRYAKALLDSDFDKRSKYESAGRNDRTTPNPSSSRTLGPSDTSNHSTNKAGRQTINQFPMRRDGAPPLPPLPKDLPPPPPVGSGILRRSLSAYTGNNQLTNRTNGLLQMRALTPGFAPGQRSSHRPARIDRPLTKSETAPLDLSHSNELGKITETPVPSPPLELTEEEKKRKEEDEHLLRDMQSRYVDMRKRTLDRWFMRKDWTVEEFSKAMEERAQKITNGEYSVQELETWSHEFGGHNEDEDPLHPINPS